MDFNRANLSIEPINAAVNDAIERAAATPLLSRLHARSRH